MDDSNRTVHETFFPRLDVGRGLLPILLAASLSLGCEPEDLLCEIEHGTSVMFDHRPNAPGGWLSHPFPSDHRRKNGLVYIQDLPNPGGSEMIESYLWEAEAFLDGFGLNTPAYFTFDGPIESTSLPKAAAVYLESEAPLQIIDVDPDSPETGRRFPLRWQYYPEGNSFAPPWTLAIAPEWGFPLRSSTTYAVIATRGILDSDGAPLVPTLLAHLGLADSDPCAHDLPPLLVDEAREMLAPLRSLLSSGELEEIVAATVFTTMDATGEVEAMREVIHQMDPPSVAGWRAFDDGQGWQRRSFQWAPGEFADYFVMEGYFESPYFIEGTIPYNEPSDGGGLYIVDGRPEPVLQETLRFALTIPDAPPRDGDCHPIVQYAHGTGGTAHGFTTRSAGRMAGRGLAAIGLDQPLHGERTDGASFDPSLRTFNVANVLATRSIMRQSAADTFSLTRLLKNGFEVPAQHSPTGERICFSVDPMLFFGHSQGGITGSLAAAFETDIDSWMLSGSGGGLGITVMQRKEPVDMEWLLRTLGEVSSDESLDELHPLVMLLHTLNEVSDPINYSPKWLLSERPRHFLVTSGCADTATPYLTALAKTAAGGIPLVEPVGTEHPWHDLAGAPSTPAPVSSNLHDTTAGHIHWPGGDHFVVFNETEAIHASMRFLDTAASGLPVIERDPNADVR